MRVDITGLSEKEIALTLFDFLNNVVSWDTSRVVDIVAGECEKEIVQNILAAVQLKVKGFLTHTDAVSDFRTGFFAYCLADKKYNEIMAIKNNENYVVVGDDGTQDVRYVCLKNREVQNVL